MHSKAHFKSLFKSPEISTVETKNIFFLNTTLPKQHNHIYFKILGATKLKIQKSQITLESEIFELAYSTSVADRWDPSVRGPHMSSTQKQSGGAVRCGRGQSSPTANSPAVTSSHDDLLDFAHRLSYVGGLLVGASGYGGGHGGVEVRVDGETPVEATVTQTQARTSIYELWLAYCALKRGMRWSESAGPR